MFTRGCRGNCTFCTSPKMWARNVNNVQIENFSSEIEFLLKKNITQIAILDDDLLVSKKTFDKIMMVLIENKEKYPNAIFFGQARLTHFTKRQKPYYFINQMVKAGIKRIYLGIESGSQIILNNMQKGIKIEQIKEVCENIKKISKNRLEIGAFWLFGHPGATVETENISINFLEELLKSNLINDLEIHNTVPFPGTKIAIDTRIKIFDTNKKHYGFLNNYPVYNLVDTLKQEEIILSAKKIKEFQNKALLLREKYLGVNSKKSNKNIEKIK